MTFTTDDWLTYVDLDLNYDPPIKLEKEDSPPTLTELPKRTPKRRPRKRLTQSQKVAHNQIERRYRININSKINALASVLPQEDIDEDPASPLSSSSSDSSSATPRKWNKSTILERATEYILQLERERDMLRYDIGRLKSQRL